MMGIHFSFEQNIALQRYRRDRCNITILAPRIQNLVLDSGTKAVDNIQTTLYTYLLVHGVPFLYTHTTYTYDYIHVLCGYLYAYYICVVKSGSVWSHCVTPYDSAHASFVSPVFTRTVRCPPHPRHTATTPPRTKLRTWIFHPLSNRRAALYVPLFRVILFYRCDTLRITISRFTC